MPANQQDDIAVKVALNHVGECGSTMLSTARLIEMGVLAGVRADRKRMAEALRNRILLNKRDKVEDEAIGNLLMQFDDILFQLADEIEAGSIGIPKAQTGSVDSKPEA